MAPGQGKVCERGNPQLVLFSHGCCMTGVHVTEECVCYMLFLLPCGRLVNGRLVASTRLSFFRGMAAHRIAFGILLVASAAGLFCVARAVA